jgi:hypothetical protein
VADVLRIASSRNAYSTTATEIAPENSAGPDDDAGGSGCSTALELRLGLAIPGDLLLKGNTSSPRTRQSTSAT